MTVVEKKDESVQDRKHRADADPNLRAELAKQAHETYTEVSLDGATAHDTHLNKDGEVIAEDTRVATLAEAVEMTKQDILQAMLGFIPAVQSGEVEVKADNKSSADDDDEVTIVLKLSRTPASFRLPKKNQGADKK